jgi:futalosine hydrolase
MTRLLVVTAVDAEAKAVGSHDGVDVLVSGAGPAAAAAATAVALSANNYTLVVSAGIAGGFAPLQPGELAVASDIVFADLGAETPDGFATATTLGFGANIHPVDPLLASRLAAASGATTGTILTVATVTGSAQRAEELQRRYPDVVAEAMEGFGVAEAATRYGVAFAEIRAISNTVGPRERDSWRIGDALAALSRGIEAIVRARAGEWST